MPPTHTENSHNTPYTHHTHTHSVILPKPAVHQVLGSTRQLASPVNFKTLIFEISSVCFTHSHLHCFRQFHRKCELSTVCDGGELKDHILLPTSICPITQVSAATHQGSDFPLPYPAHFTCAAFRCPPLSEGFLNNSWVCIVNKSLNEVMLCPPICEEKLP